MMLSFGSFLRLIFVCFFCCFFMWAPPPLHPHQFFFFLSFFYSFFFSLIFFFIQILLLFYFLLQSTLIKNIQQLQWSVVQSSTISSKHRQKELRGIDTLLRDTTAKIFLITLLKRSLLWKEQVFPLRVDSFSEAAWCAEKQTKQEI